MDFEMLRIPKPTQPIDIITLESQDVKSQGDVSMSPPEAYVSMSPPEAYVSMSPPEAYVSMSPPYRSDSWRNSPPRIWRDFKESRDKESRDFKESRDQYHSHDKPKDVAKVREETICTNCGVEGHIYRVCNLPVCSFGIVCCRFVFDAQKNTLRPEYLMVQRKDSLCYVEFIRAKWVPQNKKYVMTLFSRMTPDERMRISTAKSFDDLWYGFWHKDTCKGYMREYTQAKEKFNTLKSGFRLKCRVENVNDEEMTEEIQFDLGYVLAHTKSLYEETEWGWPKGRRNINESDVQCALREFSEETGVPTNEVTLLNMKPFEEVFQGCNNVRYKHVYFLGVQQGHAYYKTLSVDESTCQAQEIRKVSWFDYENTLSKFRDHNVERKELFKRIHAHVKQHLFDMMLLAG